MMRLILLTFSHALITLYQKVLSSDHGPLRYFVSAPRCKFLPTCSEYAKKSLQKHGILRGTALTLGRLLRCHPWSKGGLDES
ncbi:MAG: hypothetical protein UX17_C0032G0003 [Parcubacteria group bacterium GW2011_GWC2_45_7]|nr:MAG: hypothetical protein UX17_C0032G0003 [Parcubacteria group bacterium GW2011_GWC2_45_7]KKU73287.1 MAG: hypothetical protein UX98_C0009G0018 [Parcubacteria group bacterium GW2011_GWA2_47_26]